MGRDVYFMRLAFVSPTHLHFLTQPLLYISLSALYLNLTFTQGRSSHEVPLQQQPVFSQDVGEGSSGQIGDATQSDRPSQPIERQENLILRYQVPQQQYNSRGHPVNPQSRAYDRRIRAAANDVLSVVGVVERKFSDGAVDPTSNRRSSRVFSTEDAIGLVIDIVSYSSYGFATWWINIILTRLLVSCFSPSPKL